MFTAQERAQYIQKTEDTRCTYRYRDGRRCRMLRIDPAEDLCGNHWELEQQREKEAKRGKKLFRGKPNLSTAKGLNLVVARILRQISESNLPEKETLSLIRACRILLATLPQLRKEEEQQKKEAASKQPQKPYDIVDAFADNLLHHLVHIVEKDETLPPEQRKAASNFLDATCTPESCDPNDPIRGRPPQAAEKNESGVDTAEGRA